MFCYKCGNKMDDSANFCVNCGTPKKQLANNEAPVAESKSVIQETPQAIPEAPIAKPEITQTIPATAEQTKPVTDQSEKTQVSRTLLAHMAFWFGAFGVHDFIVGNVKRGILKIVLFLFSFISAGMGALLSALCIQDLITIRKGTYKTNGREIVGEKDSAKILLYIFIPLAILVFILDVVISILSGIFIGSTIVSIPLAIWVIVALARGDDVYSCYSFKKKNNITQS